MQDYSRDEVIAYDFYSFAVSPLNNFIKFNQSSPPNLTQTIFKHITDLLLRVKQVYVYFDVRDHLAKQEAKIGSRKLWNTLRQEARLRRLNGVTFIDQQEFRRGKKLNPDQWITQDYLHPQLQWLEGFTWKSKPLETQRPISIDPPIINKPTEKSMQYQAQSNRSFTSTRKFALKDMALRTTPRKTIQIKQDSLLSRGRLMSRRVDSETEIDFEDW